MLLPPSLPRPPAAAVDDSMRVGDGGGLKGHGEAIEVLALPFNSALAFASDASLPKSPGLMYGLVAMYHGLRGGAVPGRATAETGDLELRSVLPS